MESGVRDDTADDRERAQARLRLAGEVLKRLKDKAARDALPVSPDGTAHLVPLLPDDTVAALFRLVEQQGGAAWVLVEEGGEVRYLLVSVLSILPGQEP